MSEPREIERLFQRLSRQPTHAFPPPRGRLEAPVAQGVYVLRNALRVVVHVGGTPRAARGLRQRLGNHLRGNSSFTRKALGGRGSKLRRGYTYQYLEIADPRKRALLEAYAIGRLCPEHLGLGESRSKA